MDLSNNLYIANANGNQVYKASVTSPQPSVFIAPGILNTPIYATFSTNLASVTAASATIVGGTTSTGTVTLAYPAPFPLTVKLTSNNAALSVPATVTVDAGSTTANFDITTSVVNTSTNANLTANLGGINQTAKLTVNPPIASVVTDTTATISATDAAQTTPTTTITVTAVALSG